MLPFVKELFKLKLRSACMKNFIGQKNKKEYGVFLLVENNKKKVQFISTPEKENNQKHSLEKKLNALQKIQTKYNEIYTLLNFSLLMNLKIFLLTSLRLLKLISNSKFG